MNQQIFQILNKIKDAHNLSKEELFTKLEAISQSIVKEIKSIEEQFTTRLDKTDVNLSDEQLENIAMVAFKTKNQNQNIKWFGNQLGKKGINIPVESRGAVKKVANDIGVGQYNESLITKHLKSIIEDTLYERKGKKHKVVKSDLPKEINKPPMPPPVRTHDKGKKGEARSRRRMDKQRGYSVDD